MLCDAMCIPIRMFFMAQVLLTSAWTPVAAVRIRHVAAVGSGRLECPCRIDWTGSNSDDVVEQLVEETEPRLAVV